MTLQGKGFYIWKIQRVEAGDPGAIASVGAQAGMTHALIKIADGDHAYNVDTTSGADFVLPLVTALKDRGITSWGWHYVYGYDPDAEANIAIQRIQQTGVQGYVIDAEAEYSVTGRDAVARQFMTKLRASLPTFPVALSSYRYPSIHPGLPWTAFLEKCDLNMPQVYWQGSHDPAAQLDRCLREFQAITPFRPIIPTGSAYIAGAWQPTPQDLTDFLDEARNLNMTAANFWEWGHTRLYLPDLWDVIAAYDWQAGPNDTQIVSRYVAALNSHSATQVAALYDPNAVLVTAQQTIQGIAAIQAWFQTLFNQLLPDAAFTLVEETSRPGSRRFKWTAASSAGSVNDGQDSFGLVAGEIVYHYTQFTILVQ